MNARLVEIGGEQVVHAVIRDLSEIKAAEQALVESEHRFRNLVENAADPFFLIERDGRLVDVNRMASESLGYTREELLGMSVGDIGVELDLAEFPVFFDAMEDGTTATLNGTHRRKDGSTYPVEVRVGVIELEGRRHQVALARDVTERHRADLERQAAGRALEKSNRELETTIAELRQAQNQLVQQERLRALGTMASGIAHDFNNALTPITGMTDLLLTFPDILEDREKTTEYLKTIDIAAKDAATVVSRMRDFYRHRDKKETHEQICLNQAVEDSVTVTKPKWKDMAMARGIKIEVKTILDADLPAIHGDDADLRSALTNLVLNSVDALEKDGTIVLTTRKDGGDAVIEVTDTGIGMEDDVVRRIMEPFFTTKGENGSGLGLSMVYGIVERHDGKIDVESQPGKGTKFTIRIPIRQRPPTDILPVVTDVVPERLRILVADDELPVHKVLTEYLTRDGHNVESATNGREALEKFVSEEFDLVITDRSMPEMTGDELAGAIKQVSPDVPVIMLTGFGEMMNAAEELPANVDLVVSKPINQEAVRKGLASAWLRAQKKARPVSAGEPAAVPA